MYLTINNEMFPYENAQYAEVDSRITGKHFMLCLTPDVPTARIAAMKTGGVIDIQDLAEERILERMPHYTELTAYGTRRKGYWKHVKREIPRVLFWVMNKQPASITFITNKIDGMGRKADEVTDTNSIYGKIQLNMQNGVTTQIVIPETGYSCIIPAVCNKKQMPIFTKHFMVEKYIELYEAEQLTDSELLAAMPSIYTKYGKLEDYRQEVQRNIWNNINFTLTNEGFIEEWKIENMYTAGTRVDFAIKAQTSDILHKYAQDFKIPSAQAMTVEDLYNPETFSEMLQIIQEYGPKYGVYVKTTERVADTMTYMPKHWMRKKTPQDIIPDSVIMKQILKTQQSLKRAPLNELLQAYIQIDWYMNQPNSAEYLVDGYHVCSNTCDYILGRREKYCPVCRTENPDYEPDSISFDEEQYMIGTWDTYKLD